MAGRVYQLRRAAVVGMVGVGVILGGGWGAELWRFGSTPEATYTRVERSVVQSFHEMVSSLEETARGVAAHPDVAASLGRPEALPALFQIIREELNRPGDADVSVTVYDGSGLARAWAGRPSEIPSDRILGGETVFVAPGPLGLRLVHVRPLASMSGQSDELRRVGSVAVERVLSPAGAIAQTSSDAYRLSAPIAGVSLRTAYEGAGTESGPYVFELRSPSDELLLEGQVLTEDLVDARATWRRTVRATALAFLAFTVAAVSASLVVRPRPERSSWRTLAQATTVAATGAVVAFGLLRSAIGLLVVGSTLRLFDPTVHRSPRLPELIRTPADMLLLGLLLTSLLLIVAFVVDQVRFARRHAGWRVTRPLAPGLFGAHLAGGLAVAMVFVWVDVLVRDTFEGAAVDLLHTSLTPWDSGRVTVLGGVLLTTASAVWGCATLLVASQLPWHVSHRSSGGTLFGAGAWLLPGAVLTSTGLVPPLPFLPLLGGAVAGAVLIPHLRPRFRHASHAAQMMTMFLALLVPTLLAYPSLLYHGEQTKQSSVEGRYAVQAASLPEDLQTWLMAALEQIDGIGDLARITAIDAPSLVTTDTDRAFFIWRQTDLARRRLTSAVEVYGGDGRLASRFALNFPEYADTPSEWRVTGCSWEVYGEIAPFGSDERRILHAERAICEPTSGHPDGQGASSVAGSIVVHLALDYQTLGFISSGDPYTELLRPTQLRPEERAGQDVDLVIYGWGLQALFSSGQDAWSLDGVLFDRIFASREPFWTTLSKAGRRYTTFIANDRVGIYVLGYPVSVPFDHFVRLAEVSALIGLGFVLLAIAAGLGSWLTPDRYRFGRALLREVRTSFYRRLFLAFIAATLIPVLALAFVIRGYFTAQLRTDVEAGAARTAAIAQRVIEESFVLQQVGEEPTALINDDLLVWISQVLDQEINIFDGSQLVATSERDLFASGLLPTRTPAPVYSAVVLERRPSYVMEDSLGVLPYLVAATPIRAAGRDAVLTVPLASRQQEIEREIDDLDRGILLGVAIFVLLGAAGGLYMAERIADPVKRLTRATGQIARGDFDAQVAVRSADELQRLVVSFNQMAIELKNQQVQLEKTHRLEAWADMARQVAHEIKNPLTPVQLSAEHLRRVHVDRGKPLGPVLDSCVDSILTQVKLLRQISSEFSSYASSPTVHIRPTSLRDLITGVLEPYLVGLEGQVSVEVEVSEAISALALDRTLVGRAITNIVENALHAMSGKGSLEVRAVEMEETVVLTITDSGVGLDPETLDRIFEPYFSTKVSGTGLGMAIAKRNVELSGGTIGVKSVKNQGTTVTLTFSTAKTTDYAERSSSAPEESVSGSASSDV